MSTNMLVSNLFNISVLYLNVFSLFFFFPFILQSLVFHKNYVSMNKWLNLQGVRQKASNKFFHFLFSFDFFSSVSVQINCLWWSLMILNNKNRSQATYVVRTFLIPTHYFFCFCLTAISANPIQLLRKGFASILRSQW